MLSVCKCIWFSLFCHLCKLNYYFYLGNPHFYSSLGKTYCFDPCISQSKNLVFRGLFFFFKWTKCIVLIPLFTFCRILSQWTWKALWIFLPGYPFHNIVLWFHIFHIRTWHLTHVVAVISLAVTSNVIDLKMILWQFWAFIGSESPCESQYNHGFDLRMYLKCYSCLAEFWKLTKKIGEEVSDIWFSPRSSLQNET